MGLCFGLTLQDLADLVLELRDLERQPLNLRKALRRHQERAPHELHELAQIELRDEHALETSEQLTEVLRERIDVAKVCVRNAEPPIAAALYGLANRAVRRAPTENE